MNPLIELEASYCAANYMPLPVVLTRGKGVYVWDDADNRYFDMMSAYSAVSHGHCHPELVKALTEQANTLSMVSRAYYTDKLGAFLKKICEVTGQDRALPMNSGAEAVETAIKAARKWAYTVKGVSDNQAEIITCSGNFHGRTTTIVGMSTEPQYRMGFGPFASGFKNIAYGNVEQLEEAISPNTAAFLVEPIQGEAGIVVPPENYLRQCSEICKRHDVLLITDEIQTGLGRTGKLLASEHDGVTPDGLLLGKALGGGLLPVSLFLSRKDVMDVFTPGDHGSTFGGNPLAAVVGLRAIELLFEEKMIENSCVMGEYFLQQLQKLKSPLIAEVRGKGLFIGININARYFSAKEICLRLLKHGILSKDTHDTVIRLAPPLMITKEQINEVVTIITKVIRAAEKEIN